MDAPTLVVLAAGLGSRFGGPKQITPVGPSGELLLDYSVFDAVRAGFGRVVFVLRRDMEAAFREACGDRIAQAVPCTHAYQDVDDIPAPLTRTGSRTKPWGTGQAVLAARRVVGGPFAVVNADDWYGANTYAALAAYLHTRRPGRAGLAGFRLADTLSVHGTVSRGVCTVNGNGTLSAIEEVTGIGARPDGLLGRREDGSPRFLRGDETVSMNCWAFGPEVFPLLEERFAAFLRNHGDSPTAEFYLPTAIHELTRAGLLCVDVFPSGGTWCGVTHRNDLEAVRTSLAARHASGEYPYRLWR